MYGCDNWPIKKAEHWRIDAFKLWHWRSLLRVPWIARRSNQSILRKSVLNIHWKDWCWSWNSNTLELYLMWLLGKDPDAREDWRQEEKGTTEDEMVEWHHRLDGHEFERAPRVGDGQGRLVCCSPRDHRVRHDWATELKVIIIKLYILTNNYIIMSLEMWCFG